MVEMMGAAASGHRIEQSGPPGILFDYALKFLLLSAFLELVLYRLASRLGMHMAKLAEKSEAVRVTFQTLSSLGFFLLNVTALLLFLVLFILLIQKLRQSAWSGRYDQVLIPAVSLLAVLTVVYLIVPPVMLGGVVYNLVSVTILLTLMAEFLATHRLWSQRVTVGCFVLGIFGWMYYQTVSTTYGLLGIVVPPPLVHEVSRGGEFLMVLASILVLWSYGSTSLFTKNRTQRKWALTLLVSGGATFCTLLYLDWFLSLYDPALAEEARKAGQGIGWVFQMGMGYTFYLPFALYVAGFTCWAYTVVKLVLIGRLAGYGLGLMFMAGYALQLSHLTFMVIVGLMLMTLDKRGTLGKLRDKAEAAMSRPVSPALSALR